MSGKLRFDGKVVLVTGAGNGLGKGYALAFGARGAKVVVNDLGGDIKGEGQSSRPADAVVDEIRSKGGVAVASYDSVEAGEKLVKTALDNFGRIDIIINNAGILRDRSFARISDNDWDIIHRVHLRSAFLIARAAWPHMKQQNYGRIVNVTSTAGIYGNFGQANYSAAKLGVLGLTKTLAIEGQKNNILTNCIAPIAGSRLTQTVMPDNLVEALKPEYVAPLVLWLCHEECTENGGLFECGAGLVSKLRWQRSQGAIVRRRDIPSTPEDVRDNWSKITDFNDATYPTTIQEANMSFFSTLQTLDGGNDRVATKKTAGKTDPTQAIGAVLQDKTFTYTERDVILYALGVGVSTRQPDFLKFLFELNDEFCVLPTYIVIPAMDSVTKAILAGDFKGFKVDPAMILHGEQYIELFKPLSPSATLTSRGHLADVLDKGSGAVIIINVETFDEEGEKVSFTQSTIFVQRAGGFGGKRTSDKAIQPIDPPSDKPDASITESTNIDQAALYRLSGDRNPLHIDPSFAAMGGFSKPILHGLCSFGFAARHVLKQYCDNDVTRFKAFKVRFSTPVYPGESIQTNMWKRGNRVFVQCKVVETGKVCLTGAYVDLNEGVRAAAAAETSTSALSLQSDLVFLEIQRRLKEDPSLARDVNAIFQFNITKDGKLATNWTVDMSKDGKGIYREPTSGNKKADCKITVSDDDFAGLATGQLNGQQLFFSGRLKVEGNIMLTMKMQALFRERAKL